jgi:hypothetical protein
MQNINSVQTHPSSHDLLLIYTSVQTIPSSHDLLLIYKSVHTIYTPTVLVHPILKQQVKTYKIQSISAFQMLRQRCD